MSLSLSALSYGPAKLDTSGTGDGLEHYDQVCAISQAAINKAFVKLFENQPLAARSINWRNENVFDGQLKATMLPPQIELDVESGDSAKFMLQLRFDKGRIYFGQNTYQTIDGWVIAFTPLSFEDCLDTTSGDLAAAATLEDTEEDVVFKSDKPTKMCPGEYSIHRLFAAIADLNWGSIIWERSYLTQQNRQKLYLDQWARNPANNALYNEVQQCLREWTLENKLASCFTQGMLLKVPKVKVSSGKATFPARAVRLQNYPYIDESRQMELSSTKQVMKGIDGSPYNCLCFCEVVGNRVELPGTKFLPFSGNLAGPTKDTGAEYLGTFILDHRLFPGGIALEPELRIGGDYISSGRRLQVVGNTTDLAAGKPYRWKELSNNTGTATRVLVAVPGRKSKTSSLAKITIEAGPQMTTFKVSGEYGYSCRREYSSLVISDIATWTFTISINGSQDTMENFAVLNSPNASFIGCKTEKDPCTGLDILLPNDFSAALAGNPSDPTWVLMRTAMKINVGRVLAKMASEFKPFKGIDKFIFPGNGELGFGPTLLNEDMNIFATVDFSPVERRVSWPLPEAENPGDKDSDGAYTSDTSMTTDTPHLTWTSLVNSYDTSKQAINFTLTASSSSNDTRAFKSVSVTFLKMKALDGSTLFKAGPEDWEVKDESNITSTNTWSISAAKLDQKLDLKSVFFNNGLQFTIFPTVLGSAHDGTDLPAKFIIPPKGSFMLELSGAVYTKDNAGLYIVQVNEAWTGVRAIKPLKGQATTFLVLELRADGQHPAPYPVTQAVADATRGVSHT